MASAILGENDEKNEARATWRDYQRMLCGIHHTPHAKPKRVKRGPKIAPRDIVTAAAQAFARNEIDRAELMRRITPSSSEPMKSQPPFLFEM
jgi:hypothetical protein